MISLQQCHASPQLTVMAVDARPRSASRLMLWPMVTSTSTDVSSRNINVSSLLWLSAGTRVECHLPRNLLYSAMGNTQTDPSSCALALPRLWEHESVLPSYKGFG